MTLCKSKLHRMTRRNVMDDGHGRRQCRACWRVRNRRSQASWRQRTGYSRWTPPVRSDAELDTEALAWLDRQGKNP